MAIHPTAIIDPRADIDPSADIGPYAVIDGEVVVGARTKIGPHATILGWTSIGADNRIHAGAVIGDEPQDLAYRGSRSFVRIGDRNVIREHVQIHRGTAADSATELGDDNFLMATSHVGHNGKLGNRVILANGTMLGGHVTVDDRAFLGGNCCVHQHVRIGRLAFLRGGSRADKDVPPFAMLDELNVIRGINRIGLRRAGIDAESIRQVHAVFRVLFQRRRNLSRAIAELQELAGVPIIAEILEFIHASKRGVARGPARGSAATTGDAESDG